MPNGYRTISVLVKETKPRTFQTLFMRGRVPNSILRLEADGVDCDDQLCSGLNGYFNLHE